MMTVFQMPRIWTETPLLWWLANMGGGIWNSWLQVITPVFMKYDTLTMEATLVVVDMVASQWVVVP